MFLGYFCGVACLSYSKVVYTTLCKRLSFPSSIFGPVLFNKQFFNQIMSKFMIIDFFVGKLRLGILIVFH